MNIFLRILIGICIVVAGYFIVRHAETVAGWVGRSWWAETHLAEFGGTSGMVKLVGIGAIFLGFFILTGGGNAILAGISGAFIPGSL
jgi:hypothetical protein